MDALVTNQTLRGIGRIAYRTGHINPVQLATKTLGRSLTSAERLEVIGGWITERTEAVQS